MTVEEFDVLRLTRARATTHRELLDDYKALPDDERFLVATFFEGAFIAAVEAAQKASAPAEAPTTEGVPS